MAPSVSPNASFRDLPVSRETVAARDSRDATIPSTMRKRASPRFTAGVSVHSPAAAAATATARSTSSGPELATLQIGSALCGFRLTNHCSPAGWTCSPAMRLWTTSGCVSALGTLFHHAVHPPSTTTLAPVTYDDASESRNTSAPLYSSGRAIRPRGTRAQYALRKSASWRL